MLVIPVLDLLDGHAVRAVRGERSAYRPIESPLAATSEPVAVARALLAASGAQTPQTLYVADLGAILGHGAHVETLAALRRALPGTEIWLDAGYADYAAMRALFAAIHHADAAHNTAATSPATTTTPATPAALVPVFGSESLRDIHALREAEDAGHSPILSLDHRAGELLAAGAEHPTQTTSESALFPPNAAHTTTTWWPQRVIAMTLDQVGSYEGPDLRTFERIRASVPAHTTVIGAGGIRDAQDLVRAERAGATAWLVASALHDGRVQPRDLAPCTPATCARADHTNSMPDDEAHTHALRCKETASR